jgi:serine/threonine-protein phosphatase 2A regulatory subunit B''
MLQMLDMIRPATPNKITLRDLKRCKMTPIFFDTFFNLEKYLDHEQRDPFATQRETDEDGNEASTGQDRTAERKQNFAGQGSSGLTPLYRTGQLRVDRNV